MGFLYVPIVFPSSFKWVPNIFSKFPMCSSKCSQEFLTLSHILGLKFCSCNLSNQPQWGDYNVNIYFETSQSLINCFFDGPMKRCPSQKENIYSGGWRPPKLEILTKLTHVGHLRLNCLYSYYYYFEEAQCGHDLIAR